MSVHCTDLKLNFGMSLAQSAPILATRSQDDDGDNDDDDKDDDKDDNDDEARRCKLFLCKLFPSRHWLLTVVKDRDDDDGDSTGRDGDGNDDYNSNITDDGSENGASEDDRNVQNVPVTPYLRHPHAPCTPPLSAPSQPPIPSANCQGSCPLHIQHFLVIDIIVLFFSNTSSA